MVTVNGYISLVDRFSTIALYIAASIGITSTGLKPIDVIEFVNQDDRALYKAKAHGRNQSMVYEGV